MQANAPENKPEPLPLAQPDIRHIDQAAVAHLVKTSVHTKAWLMAAQQATVDTLVAARFQISPDAEQGEKRKAINYWITQAMQPTTLELLLNSDYPSPEFDTGLGRATALELQAALAQTQDGRRKIRLTSVLQAEFGEPPLAEAPLVPTPLTAEADLVASSPAPERDTKRKLPPKDSHLFLSPQEKRSLAHEEDMGEGEPSTALTVPAADAEPYDRRRTVNECRFYMGQSAEAMLEAGKRLIQLKDHEPHGDFERIVEDDLGLVPRTAQVMMKASLKFMGPQLAGPKAQTFALLGKSKLFELLTEEDDELAELAEGGTLAGHTFDEIERMSVRELRAALRKAKEDTKAQLAEAQRTLAAARKTTDYYSTKLREETEKRIKEAEQPDVKLASYRHDLTQLADQISASIAASLRSRAVSLLDSHEEFAQHNQARLLVAQALGQVIHAAQQLGYVLAIGPSDIPTHQSYAEWLKTHGDADQPQGAE